MYFFFPLILWVVWAVVNPVAFVLQFGTILVLGWHLLEVREVGVELLFTSV